MARAAQLTESHKDWVLSEAQQEAQVARARESERHACKVAAQEARQAGRQLASTLAGELKSAMEQSAVQGSITQGLHDAFTHRGHQLVPLEEALAHAGQCVAFYKDDRAETQSYLAQCSQYVRLVVQEARAEEDEQLSLAQSYQRLEAEARGFLGHSNQNIARLYTEIVPRKRPASRT